jgi:hypothetical protein
MELFFWSGLATMAYNEKELGANVEENGYLSM